MGRRPPLRQRCPGIKVRHALETGGYTAEEWCLAVDATSVKITTSTTTAPCERFLQVFRIQLVKGHRGMATCLLDASPNQRNQEFT